MTLPTLIAAVLVLSPVLALRKPREVSLEELVEQADQWMLDFDDDEDGRLGSDELNEVKAQMVANSGADKAHAARLGIDKLMALADSDRDGFATRDELVDLLRRTKQYDGGHATRDAAKTPNPSPESVGYGESHEQRMQGKGSRKKGGKGPQKKSHVKSKKEEL